MGARTKWVKRWKDWVSAEPILRGVYKRKEGGFRIRALVFDPRRGRKVEINLIALDEDDAAAAFAELEAEKRAIRDGAEEAPAPTTFKAFANALLERKRKLRELKGKTPVVWRSMLEHWILPRFGEFYVDKLRRADFDAWKVELAEKIAAGQLSPNTCNGWLRVLRVIFKAAVADLHLDRNPLDGVENFDTTEHRTYTEEEPNALLPSEVPLFLAAMRASNPGFFAAAVLMVATGLRPSHVRPLRRRGPHADLLWEQGVLLVRRSNPIGGEVLERTKTARDQRIALPAELVEILRWHVEQLKGKAAESDLLFPGRRGTCLSTSAFYRPFEEAAKKAGLGKSFTPRGARRTYQDLGRAAQVHDLVLRSVSGHASEEMQRHYSTVSADEQRAGLARIIDMAKAREALG